MYNKQCIHIDKELRVENTGEARKEGNKTKQKSSTREAECNKIKKLPKKHKNP
jgi:hypothetical protein